MSEVGHELSIRQVRLMSASKTADISHIDIWRDGCALPSDYLVPGGVKPSFTQKPSSAYASGGPRVLR